MLALDNRALSAADLSGTFAGLMDLYERNYIGLRRLIPVWPVAQQEFISRVPGNMSLHLRVIDRYRYTLDIGLTYKFYRDGIIKSEPDLTVRIYQDARQADVTSAHYRHWPMFDGDHCSELRLRWRANRFLWKWLNYCLHQGHCFDGSGTMEDEQGVENLSYSRLNVQDYKVFSTRTR